MLEQQDMNDVERFMQLSTGFAATQVLLAADELGIFPEINSSGAADAATLAARLNLAHTDALGRLLNGCVFHGLLTRDGSGRYDLTSLSRNHLIEGQPGYLGGGLNFIRRDLYMLWQNLAHAVREARPQWHRMPGGNPEGPFEAIYKNEDDLAAFMNAMFAGTYGASCEHAEKFDFSRFKHLADVGGASGAFFAAVLPKYPHLRGTIFDLPPVESHARKVMEKFGVADRFDFHPGDFFKDELPKGPDMFILGHILHDWDKEAGTALLRKIYDALPENGAVFIAEVLLNEDRVSPPATMFMDLNMLVATTGRERTAAEYEQWLKDVGFSKTEHVICNDPKSFVVGTK